MAEKKKVTAPVVRLGDKIAIPEKMPILDAIDALKAQLEAETQIVKIVETADCFPQDGGAILAGVLKDRYGYVSAKPIPSWFGDQPPQLLAVTPKNGETIYVPWGKFMIPGVTGALYTGVAKKGRNLVFQLVAEVQGRYRQAIMDLMTEVRERIPTHSIYRGRAVKLRFTDDGGESLEPHEVQPEFLDLTAVDESKIVYNRVVQRAIQTSVFTSVERSINPTLRANMGISGKRGVILAGPYGTGKTLAAFVAAKKAEQHGVTFVYAEHITDFAEVVAFALQYGPAVVFGEDIDRIMSGDRDISIDRVLNIVDGIESKGQDILILLTTNNVEAIQRAMVRPGRIDDVIEVQPPDAGSVEKLFRAYGKGVIDPEADISRASDVLKGQMPAVIMEVVERSKRWAYANAPAGATHALVSGDDLYDAACSMKRQLELLNREELVEPEGEQAIRAGLTDIARAMVGESLSRKAAA